MAEPKSISQARKMGKSYFIGKDGKRKAAVTKEELDKSGLSLRDYLNEQSGKTRRPTTKVDQKLNKNMKETLKRLKSFKPEPKKYSDTGQRPDSRPVKSTPKSKSNKPGVTVTTSQISKITDDVKKEKKRVDKEKIRTRLKNPQKAITASQKKSKEAQEKRAEERSKTELTPAQEIYIDTVSTALPAALLIKVVSKFGVPLTKKLMTGIKNLTSKQQKEVLQEANKAPTKTAAQKRTAKLLDLAKKTLSGRQSKKDRVEPYIPEKSKTFTKGQRRTADLLDAAKQSQRKEINAGYTGGALKKGGPIKKYNKGGKVVKRQEGGQVMSGNDFVSSLYD